MLMIQAKIEALLKDKIGLEVSVIGANKIARAIDKRRLACDLPDIQTYWQRLQTSSQELEELIEDLVVPETWFFRDRKPFAFLERYVKSEWLRNRNNNILRLLSLPCSSGEEPYSIAMTLLNAGLTPKQFRIDAVDISKQALLKAQHAVYQKNSFRGDEIIGKEFYFQQTSNGYEVCQLVRNTVNFIHGNLLEPFCLTYKQFDVIFCRNLLIYLESSACSQAMAILDRLLTPNGLLFVGSAETGKIPSNQFASVRHPFSFAYRKVETPSKAIEKANIKPLSATKLPIKPSIHSPNVIIQTARNLADMGQFNEAAALCKTYLTQNPTSAQAYLLLGEVYQAECNNEQAEQCYQKAIYLEPNSYEALTHLALLHEHRGDLAATAILRQRIQRLQKMEIER
jgi:chemotaxis protein methyltransferase WspC